MANTRTETLVSRTLRMVDSFKAPHVEGPIRLFNQQDILFPQVNAQAVVVGSNGTVGSTTINRTTDGREFNPTLSPFGRVNIIRLLGTVAIVGNVQAPWTPHRGGEVWFSANLQQTVWRYAGKVLSGNINGMGVNPDSGRVLVCQRADNYPENQLPRIRYTDDLGYTWQDPSVLPPNSNGFQEVRFFEGRWFAVGEVNPATGDTREYVIWYSDDDGDTWEKAFVEDGSSTPVPNQRGFHDLSRNEITGRMIAHGGNNTNFNGTCRIWYSDDHGLTWSLGAAIDGSAVGGNARMHNSLWTPYATPYGRWIISLEGRGSFAYSDDNGDSWQTIPLPINGNTNWDIGDFEWATNLEGSPVLMCGGKATGGGPIWRSDDALNWELVELLPDTGFEHIGLLTPPAIPRTFEWRLAVERYSQIQSWEIKIETDSGETLVAQTDKNDRYRGLGFNNADRDWQPTSEDDPNIAHTDEPLADDVICQFGHHLPRTKSWRTNGGYLVVHGKQAVLSRNNCYPDEIDDQYPIVPQLVFTEADVELGAWTAPADLEVNP